MMHIPHDGSSQRRGVILLVVIALLTLFAVLGISFVLYATATAEGSRLSREAQTIHQPDVDPELLFSLFLGQLLYDAPDDQTGVFSALRGHSLARSMFGLNYTPQELAAPQGPSAVAARNSVPFNGTGRLRPTIPGQPDDYYLINYTYYSGDGFLRDPERYQRRPGLPQPGQPDNRSPFQGGFNAPYTYPDLNNMFLAAVRADGSVMLPSFHRPWTGFGSLDPSNPNWKNLSPMLKYLVLRPRPADQLTPADFAGAGLWPLPNPWTPAHQFRLNQLITNLQAQGRLFPSPADAGGDVKNLIGYPGTLINGQYANNDSFWLDLDAPVMTAPDGRKYKALFAPLIMDLDNRVNLNVHGNARGVRLADQRPMHTSNQGWGPWEVNPSHLGGPIDLAQPLTDKQLEWVNMVTGTTSPPRLGRLTGLPPGATPPADVTGRIYSVVDFDGANEANRQPTDGMRLPGSSPAKPWQCFPTVVPGYGNGVGGELLRHPRLANPFTSTARGTYAFPLSNVEALLRYGDTGSPALTSELFQLAPQNFGDRNDPESIRRRNLVTVHSCDVDRPGIIPFFWAVQFPLVGNNQFLTMPMGHPAPSGARIAFPPLGTYIPSPLGQADIDFTWGSVLPQQRTLRTADHLSQLRRLNLNRPLPPYPRPDPATGLIDLNSQNNRDDFKVAQRARQIFAEEIFERLWRLTGAGAPERAPRNDLLTGRWDALRWLAQLAVNIVDFIDRDDYITPFQWASATLVDPAEWVFGTELPRLVLNEAYAQPVTPITSNIWIELYNPLARNLSLSDDDGRAILSNAGAFPVYYLDVCGPGPGHGLTNRRNVAGDPQNILNGRGSIPLSPTGVIPPRYVEPSNGAYRGAQAANEGFYVVGPPAPQLPQAPVSFPTSGLMGVPNPGSYTLVLRRLAIPHLPPNFDQNDLLFNPYVTVDYMEEVSASSEASQGRKQPYAAKSISRQYPQPPLGTPPPDPLHSFFQCNVDRDLPDGVPNYPFQPADDSAYPSYDWLVHLDRPLISPMELLHVSAYKPHELTQKFMDGGKHTHRAPWFDEHIPTLPQGQDRSLRLYRALEFFTTGHLAEGMGRPLYFDGSVITGSEVVAGLNRQMFLRQGLRGKTVSGGTWEIVRGSSLIVGKPNNEEVVRVKALVGNNGFVADFLRSHEDASPVKPTIVSDRIPGKININTVWDKETFLALCDPQQANEFSPEEIGNPVEGVFDKLVLKRTPGLPNGLIGELDKPILSMAIGNAAERGHPAYQLLYPPGEAALFQDGSGLEDTFFRSAGPSNERLLHVLGGRYPDHPYFRNQLLHKIHNHLTTRSNVFAVWLTVGFFEVKDDATRPGKLGKELVLADGSTVRHRMFAVVDRSVMTANPGPQPSFRLSTNPANPWTTGLVVPYYSIIQ